jgi:eukaryotic-like serine/threonine-protein kinase
MEKYCPKCFKKYPLTVEVCPADQSYLVSPHEKDLTGEVLDNRYTVLERIGRGGMGVVYRAEQQLIKRIVALKVLRREVVQDESAVKRFLTEAQAIASLDSRHTVTLYDFGVTREGLLYYTMELLKGMTLAQLIRKEAPLDVTRAARLVVQVCDSLKEAHGRGILHRDLKPDNLFVVVRDGREAIKVVDFGIAKLVGDSSVESVTRTGMIIGTPQYLSPEQALGNPVVPASDLYSLAIVFYEMLVGVPPFQAETPMKTMWAHIREPMPPLSAKNPKLQVPRSIEALLARALEKEPGKRFPTAIAFIDAVRKAIADHDASPETVVLPSLSTTDEGLRLKEPDWGGQTGRSEEPESGKQTEVLQAGAMVERPDALPASKPQAASPIREEQRVEERPVARPAVIAPEPVKPEPAAEPEQPAPDPKPVQPKSAPEPREAKEPSPGAPAAHAETVQAFPPRGSEVDSRPLPPDDSSPSIVGPETHQMLAATKPRSIWSGGAIAAVVVVVALLVWQPWAGSDATITEAGQEVSKSVGAAQAEEEESSGEAAESGLAEEEPERAEADEETEEASSVENEKAKRLAEESGAAMKAEATRKTDEQRKVEHEEADRELLRKAEAQRQAEEQAQREAEEERQAEEAEKTLEAEAARRADEQRMAEEANKKAEKAAEEERKRDEEKRKKEEKREKAEAAQEAAEKRAEEKRNSSLEQGRKEMRSGRYDKAITLFGRARKEGADSAEAERLTRKCYDEIRKREVAKLVAKGNDAFTKKKWADCVKHLEAAAKLGANDSEIEKRLKKCKAMMMF